MKKINIDQSKLSKKQKQTLSKVDIQDKFSSSITNGGSFSSFNGDMQHYTDKDWLKIAHLTEIEVTEKEKEGELKGGRKYYQSWGTCYFVDSKILKELAIK